MRDDLNQPKRREGRIQGATDNPLNATGREQAAALAKTLADVRIDAVYSSSHQRARQTAAAFEGRAPITAMDELRERSYGKFEGASEKDAALVADWNKRRATFQDDMEGGESLVFASGMAAVMATLMTLIRPGDVVVAVADGYPGVRAVASGSFQ